MTATKTKTTALEFANDHADEGVIVRFASQGHPAGIDVALLPETELPFDLAAIEGEVGADGQFTALNLNDGHRDARGWKFRDWNRNTVYAIWLRVDRAKWQAEYNDYLAGE